MTAQQIATEVWAQISDDAAGNLGVRYPIGTLYQYMYEGERAIVRRHPEAQYINAVAAVPIVLMTTPASTPTISDDWLDAICHYVAARVFGEDSEDLANSTQSEIHYKHFMSSISINDQVVETKNP